MKMKIKVFLAAAIFGLEAQASLCGAKEPDPLTVDLENMDTFFPELSSEPGDGIQDNCQLPFHRSLCGFLMREWHLTGEPLFVGGSVMAARYLSSSCLPTAVLEALPTACCCKTILAGVCVGRVSNLLRDGEIDNCCISYDKNSDAAWIKKLLCAALASRSSADTGNSLLPSGDNEGYEPLHAGGAFHQSQAYPTSAGGYRALVIPLEFMKFLNSRERQALTFEQLCQADKFFQAVISFRNSHGNRQSPAPAAMERTDANRWVTQGGNETVHSKHGGGAHHKDESLVR